MSNEQTAADIARIESMYGDRDSFLKAFPEAERLRVSGFIDSYPEEDRDRVRMKMANVQLLATAFKLSTDETIDRYDQLQASYAQQVLKQDSPMDMDEVKFHGLVQQRVEKRKALRTKGDAIESAMVEAFMDEARPDFDKTFTRIVGEKQKAGVMLDADETAELRQTLANRWNAMANDEETYGNAIGATVAYFNKNKRATVNTVTPEQQAALMALNGLDRNAQEFVIQKAAHLAKVTAADVEKEGGWSKFLKRSGRAISDLDRYAAQAINQIGAMPASALGDSPAFVAQTKAVNNFFDLERRMSNALQGYVDPAKGNSWISEALIAAGSNAPRMALALTPPGLVVNALAYKTELEGNLLDRGLTQEQASKLAMIGAPVMAALDYAEVGFAFKGWVPGGKALTSKVVNQLLKAGVIGGLETVQQVAQESAQDLVAPVLQSIGSVLSSEIPEVQWMDKDGKPGEWSQTWSNMPNTFQALLPYILLGTGKNRWDAGFNERFHGWTRQYLTAAGYDAQTVKDAMAAPDAEAAQKVLIAGFDKRDITTPAAQAAIAATNERMQQMAASLTPSDEVAASLTAESPDYVPSVAVSFRHSETGLDVLDEKGEIIAKTSSPQEAAMVALRYQKNQAAINEATAFAESKVPLPDGSTIQVYVMPDGKRNVTVNVMLDPNATDTNLAGESMELQQAKDAGYDVPNIPENTPQGDYTPSQLISGNISEEAPAQAKETNYEEEYLKLDKAHIDKYREDMGLEAVETPEVRKHIVLMEQAKVNDPSGMATDALAQSLLVKPQPVTDAQHAAFVKRMIDVTNAHKQAMRLATEAYDGGNFAEAKRQFAVADALVEQYDVLLRAKRLAGTETGRALSAIRMAASLKTYDLVNVVARMQSASGKKLDPDLLKELQRVTKELEEAKAKLEALEKQDSKDSEQQQKDDTDAFVEQAKSGKKPATRNDKRKFGRKPKKLTREELIAKLGELGFDPVNGGEVTPAVADVIAKLAEINAEEGAKTLSDIDGRVKQDIPAVSEDTIHQAMAGKIAEEATPKKELNRQLEEFKKQAGLWADIHAILESGQVEAGKPAALQSEKVGQLKEILGKLRLNALKEERDNAKFLELTKRFNAVQDMLQRGYREIPADKARPVEPKAAQAVRKQIAELEHMMAVQDSIYTMEERIRRNEPPTHKRRKEESDELFTAHLRQRELRRDIAKMEENYIFKSLSLADKSVKRISETGEFLRSAKATADFSAAFRQAVFLAPKRPIAFTTAFVKAARAFFDSNYAEQIDYNMRRQPQQIYRDRANLYLSSIDGKMTGREESFTSSMIERVPGFGSIARGSNRNMVVMLNLMRAEAFDSFMKSHPEATAQTRNMMARYINIATGRGELGKLEPVAGFLAKFAFSPRFVASRIELLGSPFYFAVKDRTVAKEVMKDWLAFHATGMAVLALASMAGARVGEEPEKHTFGKIQFGPLIIDIWGGLQQPASLTLKAVAAAADNHGAYELEKDINMLDAGLRFLAYKASPGVTVPYTALFGRDFMGNKMTLEEALARSVIPMTIETFGEVYDKTDSAGWASFAAGLSFVGVGVQVEKKKQYRR